MLWLLRHQAISSFLRLTVFDLDNTVYTQQQATPEVMKWNKAIVVSVSGGMNTAFRMVQDKRTYLKPDFHLLTWYHSNGFGPFVISLLLPVTFTCTQPCFSLCLLLFYLYNSFFLQLLLDGDTLSKEMQINSLELELITLRPTQIHLLYSERAIKNKAHCAPHSDCKRIITYYSFLDPRRTSEASLMLHCLFLVPINRKHAPNS